MKQMFILFSAIVVSAITMAADVAPKAVIDFSDSTNVWKFPDTLSKDTTSYTYQGQTVKIYPSASTAKDQGYKLTRVASTATDTAYSYLIFGKKNYKIELPAFSFKVGKIVVFGSPKAGEAVETNVFVGETAVSTSYIGAKLPNQLPTFVINSAYRAVGNQYSIKVLNDKNMQITKIVIYEEVVGAPENPVFSPKGGTYASAQNVTLGCATDGATIQYSYDGSAYLDYLAPLSVEYTQTIYAKAVKNQIESDVVAATYQIISLDGDGSKEKPYTVADVAKLANPGDTAWVEGIILGCADKNGNLAEVDTVDNKILLGTNATDSIGVPVQLSKNIHKNALGLKSNPTNKGKRLKVYGVLENYLSHNGVTKLSDYELDGKTTQLKLNNMPADKATKYIEKGKVIILHDHEKYSPLGTKL